MQCLTGEQVAAPATLSLTVGTGPERNSTESTLGSQSAFVHAKIWQHPMAAPTRAQLGMRSISANDLGALHFNDQRVKTGQIRPGLKRA